MTDYLHRSTDYHDLRTASSFDEVSFWASRFGALLFEHIELARGIEVLDLGCGTGFPLFEIARRLGAASRVTGVDLWEEGLARAALKLDVSRPGNVGIVRADGARLPLPDAQFDLIVSNLGLNNFEHPPDVVKECRRVVRSGGRLVLTTNLEGHMAEFYSVYRETLVRLGLERRLDRLAANEEHRGTKESVGALLESGGFRVTRVVEDRFRMRYVDGSALLRHPLTVFGFLEGWRAVVDREDEERVFAALEDRLNHLADENGELSMTIPMLYLEARRT